MLLPNIIKLLRTKRDESKESARHVDDLTEQRIGYHARVAGVASLLVVQAEPHQHKRGGVCSHAHETPSALSKGLIRKQWRRLYD